ncbi:MAG: ATP-binding cassette domain-containing protein [bacterium JZ-2024 1]
MTTNDCVRRFSVKKSLRGKEVLKGSDLEVLQESVFSLIGANGSGKTTIFKIRLNRYSVDTG